MFWRHLVVSVLCLSVLSGCGSGDKSPANGGGPPATRYAIMDLGYATAVYSLNKSGQVLLRTSPLNVSVPPMQTFLVTGNNRVEVDTLGGEAVNVLGVNDSGQMFGTLVSTNSSSTNWFLYSGGVLTHVPTPPKAFPKAVFNNNAQIAGITQQPPTTPPNSFISMPSPIHVVLYSAGTLTDLGTPFGATSGSVVGINDAGQITGTYQDSQQNPHGFLYSNGQFTDIGSLGGPYTAPVAINNQGQIAGDSSLAFAGEGHAFIYSNGKMMDLNPGNKINVSTTYAINNLGQVVQSDFVNPNVGFGYLTLLSTNGASIDLNMRIPADPAWLLDRPTGGINDKGQIAGLGTLNGVSHAFIMTPQ